MTRLDRNIGFMLTAAFLAGLASCNSAPVADQPTPPMTTDNPAGGTDTSITTDTSTTDTSTNVGTSTSTGAGDAGANRGKLTVTMRADYDADLIGPAQVVEGCPEPPITEDFPGLPDGADCDGDGGVVHYITPSTFRVAIKRLSLLDDNGGELDIVPDAGTLGAAQVVDLASPVTLFDTDLPPGRYVESHAEFYYYELVMPLNQPPVDQAIRVYLSDDDFPEHGNLGHHQGDITLVDASGTELGFAPPGGLWATDALLPARGDTQGGSGADPETGHLRGLYGDFSLWDSPPFVQGPTRDLFLLTEPFDLELTPSGVSIAIVFNLSNCWYYEDFDANQTFNPCGAPEGQLSDACHAQAGWSPVFPTPQIIVEQAAP